MDYQLMKFGVRDNVAWITFNRPEAFNAINFQATSEFYDIVNLCNDDRLVRAVVLTGAGDRAFCAGGDVAGFVKAGDQLQLQLLEMTTALHTSVSRLAWLESQMERETRSIIAISRTQDAREDFKAFVEKRKPSFVGE